ncbi:MAG TPA: peptidoglycan DD-metalloendopeptidase family protein [bacterium]|nr:peptidoglycan DD-metalloendopeptidase family protein [bacterium]
MRRSPRISNWLAAPAAAVVMVALLAPRVASWRATPALISVERARAGNVAPVVARVPGTVAQVSAVAREHVKAGTVLVELDPTTYRLTLVQARARVAKARAAVGLARTALSDGERAASVGVGEALRTLPPVHPVRPAAQARAGTGDRAVAEAVVQAERQMAAARADVLRAAQAQLDSARQQTDRDQALLADGAIPADRLAADTAASETARAQVEAAAVGVRQAQTRLASASSAPPQADRPEELRDRAATSSEIEGAQEAVAQAQARARTAGAELAAARQQGDHDQALLVDGAIPAQQVAADGDRSSRAQARADVADASVREAQAHLVSLLVARRDADLSRQATGEAAAEAARQVARAEGLARRAEAQIVEAQRRARDLAAAQADVIDAEDAARSADVALAQTVIRAPASGWIMDSAVAPGQRVRTDQRVMLIAIDPAGAPDAVPAGSPAPGAIDPPAGRPAAAPPSGTDAWVWPGAALAVPQQSGERRERLVRIAEQEHHVLADLEAESARIRAIVVRSGSGEHRGPVPTLLNGRLPWPVKGDITSEYGWRIHPIFHTPEFHTGIDIAAPMGTVVRAPADGTVIFSGWMPANGMLVILDHGNGLSTTYSHLSSSAVRVGEHVWKSQVIARVGSTGWSTGPHLYFEIREGGRPVDPLEP